MANDTTDTADTSSLQSQDAGLASKQETWCYTLHLDARSDLTLESHLTRCT